MPARFSCSQDERSDIGGLRGLMRWSRISLRSSGLQAFNREARGYGSPAFAGTTKWLGLASLTVYLDLAPAIASRISLTRSSVNAPLSSSCRIETTPPRDPQLPSSMT